MIDYLILHSSIVTGTAWITVMLGLVTIVVATFEFDNEKTRKIIVSMSLLMMSAAICFGCWVGAQKDKNDDFIVACRALVEQNKDPVLVAKCVPHLAKIDAETTARETEKQAARERWNAETVRAHRP